MNSRTQPDVQSNLTPTEDLGLELALLCDALDMLERGGFLFAICEEGPLRQRLMRQVRDHLQAEGGRDLIELELSPEQPDPAARLEQQLLYGLPEEVSVPAEAERVRDRPRPPVVFVHTRKLADAWMDVAHLPEDHPDRVRVELVRRALRALNFQRERLGRLNVPLLFWLDQNALGQVMQHAADVFAARSGLFYFEALVREPAAPPPMRAEAAVRLLDRFHRTLLPPEELRKRAALYERRLERERSVDEPNWPGVAFLCRDLSNIHRELDGYERAEEFQRQAITAYQKAIAEREAAGGQNEEWAALQVWLGNAYADLPTGDRAANLQQAIEYYQDALRVYTPQAAPLQYAMTQNNLGNAYRSLPSGERAANLQKALQYVEAALRVKGLAPWEQAEYLFTRGLIHLALGHPDQALSDYQAAVPLADAITIAGAMEELDEFAAGHPDTPGLDAVRALFPSSA